jgi:hypothetical protein
VKEMADKKETSVNSIITSMEQVYGKLPSLPTNVKDFIVMVTPWLALIFGILGVLGSLSAFGISVVASPLVALGGGFNAATGLIVATIIGLVACILELVAFPGLLKRKMSGWKFLFWVEALGVLSAIISLSGFGVIMALIWFYFLFQIKSYYK